MFLIDKENNKLQKIVKSTFHELGFKEREHLQEWIAKEPTCLDEELLIIQKEFDGFSGTNERLDLLALDRTGALVVIENKLDDTGRDVTWQALKYVSYCSTLSKTQIVGIYQDYLDKYENGVKAEDKLIDFFDGQSLDEIELNNQDQRMILVAGNFRKEVTSTVMWMINHNISVKCFKATPYKHGDELLLDIEQIIPVKEAADYYIKMADKAKEAQSTKESNKGIEELRKKYWIELLDTFNGKSKQYQNVSPSTDHWLSSGSGVSGITFAFIATKKYASVEITINHGDQEENKKIYDLIYEQKDEIERTFGDKLFWERLDLKISCRISYRLEGVNISDLEDWQKIKEFHCDAMPRFDKALRSVVQKVVKEI
jgi:hypothetical protein